MGDTLTLKTTNMKIFRVVVLITSNGKFCLGSLLKEY
jgi:hypothetical protein